MTRLSLVVAFLALAFSGGALAAPPASQEVVVVDDVHTMGGWSYSVCGTRTLVFRNATIELKRVVKGAPTTLSLSILSRFLQTRLSLARS